MKKIIAIAAVTLLASSAFAAQNMQANSAMPAATKGQQKMIQSQNKAGNQAVVAKSATKSATKTS